MDISLLRDTTGSSPAGHRGDVRVLFLRVVEQRPHSAPLPARREGWAVSLGKGTVRSAVGGLGGALRQSQTLVPKAYTSGRSVVAVQPPCVPPSLSGVIPGDRSRGPASISAHAPMGAIREPVRGGQGEYGASFETVYGSSRVYKPSTAAFRSRYSRSKLRWLSSMTSTVSDEGAIQHHDRPDAVRPRVSLGNSHSSGGGTS